MSDFTQRHPTEPSASPEDGEPDTVATPEGDNEFANGEPILANEPAPERPRGNEPHPSQPIRPAQE